MLTPRKADRTISKELHRTDRQTAIRMCCGEHGVISSCEGAVGSDFRADVSWSGGGGDGRDRRPRQVTLAHESR